MDELSLPVVVVCLAVMSFFIFSQSKEINRLETQLSNFVYTEETKDRAIYVNNRLQTIESYLQGVESLANSAYEIAVGKQIKYGWIQGLTTEQIDSVRMGELD